MNPLYHEEGYVKTLPDCSATTAIFANNKTELYYLGSDLPNGSSGSYRRASEQYIDNQGIRIFPALNTSVRCQEMNLPTVNKWQEQFPEFFTEMTDTSRVIMCRDVLDDQISRMLDMTLNLKQQLSKLIKTQQAGTTNILAQSRLLDKQLELLNTAQKTCADKHDLNTTDLVNYELWKQWSTFYTLCYSPSGRVTEIFGEGGSFWNRTHSGIGQAICRAHDTLMYLDGVAMNNVTLQSDEALLGMDVINVFAVRKKNVDDLVNNPGSESIMQCVALTEKLIRFIKQHYEIESTLKENR